MIAWLQKNAWWLSLIVTLLVAFFPSTFKRFGEGTLNIAAEYWLQFSIAFIIVLLLVLVVLNAKASRG